MRRREFLAKSAAALSFAGLADLRGVRAETGVHHPIGLQLFTVMAPLEADFEGTIEAVAKIGYKEVETIGAFGRDPAYVRRVFDRYGLVSPSQHLVPGNLYEVFNGFVHGKVSGPDIQKLWQETMAVGRITPIVEEGIARAKVLGQKYVVLQIIWPEQMATRALMDQFCKALNTAGDLCAKAGLTFNFHNHDREFVPVSGYVPYDLILENTDPDTVKLEMDVYWVTHAKADPLRYLAKYPGRYTQFHLKDSTPQGDFATVGQGVLNFPQLIHAADKAGIRHYYVEYDRSTDPMKATRESYDYLKTVM